MTVKQRITGFAGVALMLAGSAIAQGPRGEARHGKRDRVEFMSRHLNLTEAQKEQAKSVFSLARESSKPIAQQLREGREAVAEATKANRPAAEIEALTSKQGALMGQLSAIQAKAFASFYATLTPEQKQKADQMQAERKNRMGKGFRKGPQAN